MPTPLTEAEQLAVFEASIDQRWSWVTEQYPSALRPEVELVRVVDSKEWGRVMARCLTDAGFPASSDDTGYSVDTSTRGGRPSLFAEAEFACNARYPDRALLAFLQSEGERNALYDYYTGFVRPCLALAGQQPTLPPPSREDFVAESIFRSTWHPYLAVWQRAAPSDDLMTSLQFRCPPEPAWSRR